MSYFSVKRSLGLTEPTFAKRGERDILSTPPATMTFISPAKIACVAKCTACWLEPHCRSSVTPGTSVGNPASKAAVLATFIACSFICVTQPMITSSTASFATSDRSIKSFNTSANNSSGRVFAKAPFLLATAERQPSTITTSRKTDLPFSLLFRTMNDVHSSIQRSKDDENTVLLRIKYINPFFHVFSHLFCTFCYLCYILYITTIIRGECKKFYENN